MWDVGVVTQAGGQSCVRWETMVTYPETCWLVRMAVLEFIGICLLEYRMKICELAARGGRLSHRLSFIVINFLA